MPGVTEAHRRLALSVRSWHDARLRALHLPETSVGAGAAGQAQAALMRPLPLQLQKRQAAFTKPSHGKIIYGHYAIFPSGLQAVFEKK